MSWLHTDVKPLIGYQIYLTRPYIERHYTLSQPEIIVTFQSQNTSQHICLISINFQHSED